MNQPEQPAVMPPKKHPAKIWVAERKPWTNVMDAFDATEGRPCPEHHGAIYLSKAESDKLVSDAIEFALSESAQYHCCFTGDCPHEKQCECVAYIKNQFEAARGAV